MKPFQVWSHDTLLYNLTEKKPNWNLVELPPDTDLILRLYSTSAHTISDPLLLYARTKPHYYPIKSGKKHFYKTSRF